MARTKLNLAYISNEKTRKTTFIHRKKGFLKKLEQLKVLCDIDACAIIYNPFTSNPEVWPSNSGVTSVLEKFEKLTESEKTFRSLNHEGYLKQEIEKVKKQSQKLAEENKEDYMRELMFGCLSGNMGGLSLNDSDRPDLCSFIDQYLIDLVHHKNVTLNNPHFEIGESSSMAMATNVAPTAVMAPTAIMAPPAMAEPDASIFEYPHQNDEAQTIISNLAKTLADDNSLASSLLPGNNQEVYIPVMNQDESYYPNHTHNQNQQPQRFVEEMLNLGEQTGFPWMEDNNHFNHHQF